MASVKVIFGADVEEFENLVGVSVSDAEPAARNALSVPSDTEVRINNSATVMGSYILKGGDEISFYKPSGSKGY